MEAIEAGCYAMFIPFTDSMLKHQIADVTQKTLWMWKLLFNIPFSNFQIIVRKCK